jgi:predicted NBD/HSP70 family sugar kinase
MTTEKPILSVDGGGSGFRKALVLGTQIWDLQESTGIERADQLLDFVSDNLLPDIDGISFAVAGVIEDHNKIIVSPNISFLDGVSLGKETRNRTKKKTTVCNDMEAATIGMSTFFPRLKYFMGITWSSGIGLRIFKDGEILSDSEGGHMNIDSSPSASLCECGLRGCAEARLGGKNLQRAVIYTSEIYGFKIPEECKYPSMYLHPCFDKKERWAVDIYDDLCSNMARFLANIQSLLHLPAVVWKGALGQQVLTRAEGVIREKMKTMIIDSAWEEDMKFYDVWHMETCKDADALIGAAEIFRNLFIST